MQWYEIVLSYLKVLLSLPVIILVIVLIFRRELGKLPGRMEQIVFGKDNRIIFGPAKAKKIAKKLDTIANKPTISKKQQTQLQKDLDSVFELGVAVGLDHQGKPFTDISNVQLIKDEKGNITGLQYNEK
jgi:hypothetical protein